MKYLNIYKKCMEKELHRIDNRNMLDKDGLKQSEWAIIAVALKNPKESNEALYKEYKDVYEGLKQEQFMKGLRCVNLDTVEKRDYIQRMVSRSAKDFKSMLHGNKKATQWIGKYIDNIIERDMFERRTYFKAKYLLVYLILLDEEMKSDSYVVIIKNYLEKYCSTLLRMIYKDVCREMGFKKTAKEMIESTRKVLEETENSQERETTNFNRGDKDKLIEDLQFQINNYSNALSLVQSMFDELRDTVEESANEARTAAVSEFFASLNAKEYGNILDNMLTVEDRLLTARTQKVKIPPEIMPLTIIFKQLLRFIKEYGITPIETNGREYEVTYGEIALTNYEGEPFFNDKEKKRVKVVAPGWMYQNVTISLPTVREVE